MLYASCSKQHEEPVIFWHQFIFKLAPITAWQCPAYSDVITQEVKGQTEFSWGHAQEESCSVEIGGVSLRVWRHESCDIERENVIGLYCQSEEIQIDFCVAEIWEEIAKSDLYYIVMYIDL